MCTLSIIKKLCKSHKITISKLEKDLGYGNGSIAKSNSFKSERLLEISKYFNVSMEYLMGEDEPDTSDDFGIGTIAAHHDNEDWTDEEREELEKFKDYLRSKKK